MVKSISGALFSNPIKMRRSETSGSLASLPKSLNIFTGANISSPPNIFGSSPGSTETSGSCACGSSGGGGSTVAIA